MDVKEANRFYSELPNEELISEINDIIKLLYLHLPQEIALDIEIPMRVLIERVKERG